MAHKPKIATPENVTISREGESAFVQFTDSKSAPIELKIGEAINLMDDLEVLELHNDVVRAQLKASAIWRPTEIAEGFPQIKFDRDMGQWSAESHVLRCLIKSGADHTEPTIRIDNTELSLKEFGVLISHFDGWGMRVAFMPEEKLNSPPAPVKRKAAKKISKRKP